MENNTPITPLIEKTDTVALIPGRPGGGGARTMDFPDAMRAVKNGKIIRRISWPSKDHGLLKDGWLMVFTDDKYFVWKVSDGDFEGQDWVIVNEANGKN